MEYETHDAGVIELRELGGESDEKVDA